MNASVNVEEDDEWYAPEPYGVKGELISVVGIIIVAVFIHYGKAYVPKTVPPTHKELHIIIPGTQTKCNFHKLAYSQFGWHCSR